MISTSITINDLFGNEVNDKTKFDIAKIFQPNKEGMQDSFAFNDDIDYVGTISESDNSNKINSRMQKLQLLNQLEYIEILGNEWTEEDVKGPNEFTLAYSKELIAQIVENGLVPIRITQSIEEGISFVFKKNRYFLYLEIYNDQEIGILIEDYENKKIVANKELFTQQEIIFELLKFYNYV